MRECIFLNYFNYSSLTEFKTHKDHCLKPFWKAHIMISWFWKLLTGLLTTFKLIEDLNVDVFYGIPETQSLFVAQHWKVKRNLPGYHGENQGLGNMWFVSSVISSNYL